MIPFKSSYYEFKSASLSLMSLNCLFGWWSLIDWSRFDDIEVISGWSCILVRIWWVHWCMVV